MEALRKMAPLVIWLFALRHLYSAPSFHGGDDDGDWKNRIVVFVAYKDTKSCQFHSRPSFHLHLIDRVSPATLRVATDFRHPRCCHCYSCLTKTKERTLQHSSFHCCFQVRLLQHGNGGDGEDYGGAGAHGELPFAADVVAALHRCLPRCCCFHYWNCSSQTFPTGPAFVSVSAAA